MTGKLIDLRRRAEDQLVRHGARPVDSTGGDPRSAVAHELEVTRIEVDLQHEELELQRTEAEAARDRYAALCDAAPVAVLVLDTWGLMLDGNEMAWRMLGLRQLFERRVELTLFLHWSDADRLRRGLRGERRGVLELQIRPRNRASFPALVALEPIPERPGTCRAAIIDLSARGADDSPAAAEAERASATASILVVDDNRDNRALVEATLGDEGYRVRAAASGEEAVAMASAERPACIVMDVRMPTMDGITACERIRALPGGGDIAVVFVTAQRDVETFDRARAAGGDDFITKPFRPQELVVRVETALRLHRIEAERSELYGQLKQQRDALQRLELQKQQLVAFLVHDLKNPTNAIDLLVLNALRTDDRERARRAITRIGEESRALMRMITNLLDISRADEGQLAPAVREVEPAVLVDGVLDELRARAESADLRVVTAISAPRLHADPELLSRVLLNLIDNAIRFSPEGSEIRVALAPSADGVELRVADQGPGVPPEARGAVFERFHSGSEKATRNNRGLGLAFCKLAVEAHRGRIWIEDAAPGAVFCVSLPGAAPSQAAAGTGAASP